MTRLEYTFKNDMLFKMFFVKHPDLLKRLISNLLGIRLESIGNFEIRNAETPPEQLGDKFCRLDITMTLDGQRVDLEIQVRDEGDYPARALYYWAREYSTALLEGGKYEDLPRTVIISILDFRLFDCVEFHSEYAALEVRRHTPLTDKFSLHFFELPKLPAMVDAENELLLWLNLFKADTEEELARIQDLEVPIMTRTIEAYHNLTATAEFQERERMRSKARHDEAQALSNAERKGQEEGRREEKLDVARKLMGMGLPIEKIMEGTGLTREEIEKLRS